VLHGCWQTPKNPWKSPVSTVRAQQEEKTAGYGVNQTCDEGYKDEGNKMSLAAKKRRKPPPSCLGKRRNHGCQSDHCRAVTVRRRGGKKLFPWTT